MSLWHTGSLPAAIDRATPRADHPRVCFLFNHDQIHQIAHSLPVAMALARSDFAGEVMVATTNQRLADEVRLLSDGLLGTAIQHIPLALSASSHRIAKLLRSVIPAEKLLIYRDNLDFFRSLDLLVVAEKTSLLLKSRYGLKDLVMVHTRHGAGDRAIGFDKASAGFDHVLCSGPKIKERLVEDSGLSADAVSIIGYPKFDMTGRIRRVHPLHQARPVVLYSPHVSPHLSSWYRHGRQVLDIFVQNADYDLIFAPHVMLFERNFVVTIDKLTINRAGSIPQRCLRGDNIHIDLGSRASTDMRYTLGSDIYIGDASSQVYEFLMKPRPCIFLNSHGHAWRGNPDFRHWEAGEVITHPSEIPAALARAQPLHDSHFRAVQERLFAERFDLTDIPSSDRGARVIADLAQLRRTPRVGIETAQAA